jgi:hypothetical protein
MKTKEPNHGLSHLQDQADARDDVLVVDFDTLSVIDAVASNVSKWGLRLSSPEIHELYKNIGIRTKDAAKLIKAQITSVKGEDAAVVFCKNDTPVSDKRREKRNDVSFAVKIADLDGITEITGTIVDAAKNGCRVEAKGLTALPEEVLLTMRKFDRPVVAEFAWRNETSAGLRLLWDRTLERDEETETGQTEAGSPATETVSESGNA